MIVPVRGTAPRDFAFCLGKLFDSTYSRYEVIVVDDASTDLTADAAVEWGHDCCG